jgi:molybdate transport system substrate-binding protein
MQIARFGILGFLLALSAVAAPRPVELNVFAAASLTDALKEVASGYEDKTGDKIVFNFGASSLLARQIIEGAPADIFFSADEAKMNGLEARGLILKGTRKSRLSNSLVIVVAADGNAKIDGPKDLASAKINRIALAEPKSVPAGIYAKQFLEKVKIWSTVEPKIVPTENVRAALAAIESGNVDAAIVYKTDAAISRKVKVAYEVPPTEGPDIVYPLAVVKESKNQAAAKRLLTYLNGSSAARVFEKYGFMVLP